MNQPTQKTLEALEKVFAAEIGGMIFQSEAKIFEDLAAEGLVEKVYDVLGGGLPVVITGYALTHKGRIMYCESCKDEEDNEG